MTTRPRHPAPGSGSGAVPGAPAHDGALRTYVGVWALLGIGALIWALTSGDPTAAPPPAWLVAALGVSAAATGLIHVTVTIRGVREATTLNELAVIPLMVLLPPGFAVVTGLAAAIVAESVLTRGQLRKLVFNVAWQVTAIALGAQVHALLATGPFTGSPAGVAAASAAAAAYLVVNVVALTGVLRIVSGRRLLVLVPEDAPSGLLVNAGAAVVGVLVATLAVAAPAGLPLVAVLPWIDSDRLRARSTGYDRLADERDRFVRTVDGSSDGVILLDRAGHVEVWNPAAARLTGVPSPEALGATLSELELSRLDPGPDAHRAVRMPLRDTVVDVSRSRGRTEGHGGAVLTLRDVSHEAEMARLRDDLVSRVSHEIRTPVTTVAGCLQTLQSHWGALPDERRHDLVLAAGRGADRLGTMVANLLALSRIETSIDAAPGADARSCEVTAVVREVVDGLGLQDLVDVHDGAGLAAIDAADLRLVVRNLLENAVRYGDPPIEVSVRGTTDHVVLRVRDHGAGMPPETAREMFQAFAQGDDGLRRTSQGIGVGLAVVSSLVAASGGRVGTRAVATGTCVEVSLLPAGTGPGSPEEQSAA